METGRAIRNQKGGISKFELFNLRSNLNVIYFALSSS
jgi:hypothetical protein